MFGYYKDDLQRVLGADDGPYYYDFARVLAAVTEWIGADELLQVLKFQPSEEVVWRASRRDDLIRKLTWFLESRQETRNGRDTVCYRLQHESVRDFLVSPRWRGPASEEQEVTHARIGECFRTRASEGDPPGWCHVAQYGRLHAVAHFLQTRQKKWVKVAAELLHDPDYLEATLGDEPAEGTSEGAHTG
jgi:hypothetical protein